MRSGYLRYFGSQRLSLSHPVNQEVFLNLEKFAIKDTVYPTCGRTCGF
jgi:hypothetical protein